jgi:hypothetical protein
MIISACGLVCTDCNFYNNACSGCFNVQGKTFWAKDHTEKGICPLFDCAVNLKKLEHCGNCSELPCKKFHDLKDPNITKEEHLESINKRVEILRN